MTGLSGFEVLALVKEIGSALEDSYVNNIYSLGDAQVLRFRRTGGGDVWLVASPSQGMWISEAVAERAETSEFTSKLRSEIQRLKFSKSAQSDLDRVFELALGEGESARKLVLELMPPGNVILLDPGGRIVLAAREVKSARRKIARGEPYVGPAQGRLSPGSLKPEDIAGMAAAEATVGKAIGKHVAIPRKYVQEALVRLSLREDDPSSRLSGREAEASETLAGLVREAGAPTPCMCRTPSGEEIFVIRPRAFEVVKAAKAVSSLCDEALLPSVIEAAARSPDVDERRRMELEATVSKLKQQEEGLKKEASLLRSMAAQAAAAASPEDAAKTVKSAGLKAVPRSAAAASSMLYDQAKHLEQRAANTKLAAKKLTRKALAGRAAAPAKTKALPKKRQEWYEKFRWFYTTGGRLAIGGRDAQTNSILVRRYLDDKDTVYHADLFGSPFFVLKGGAEQSEEESREVAQATVTFSSAWKTGLGAADAYWVGPDQVGTAAPSGEYLARGSFVIKGRKNFVPRNLVELAVGVDGASRLVSGPEPSIRSHCSFYVTVKPFREKASDTAKRVLKDLEEMGGAVLRGNISLDDVLRALPAGGGKIVRKVRQKESGHPGGRETTA